MRHSSSGCFSGQCGYKNLFVFFCFCVFLGGGSNKTWANFSCCPSSYPMCGPVTWMKCGVFPTCVLISLSSSSSYSSSSSSWSSLSSVGKEVEDSNSNVYIQWKDEVRKGNWSFTWYMGNRFKQNWNCDWSMCPRKLCAYLWGFRGQLHSNYRQIWLTCSYECELPR